jgi:hypothetical protein
MEAAAPYRAKQQSAPGRDALHGTQSDARAQQSGHRLYLSPARCIPSATPSGLANQAHERESRDSDCTVPTQPG